MANKLIKCKSCGADIAKSAKSCPSCGAKNKKAPIPVIVLSVLALCLIAAALGGGAGSDPQRIGTASPGASPSPTPEQTVFAVGDKVSLNNVDVTFVSCEETSGSQFMKPAQGNSFILCEFTIENNSAADIAVSSLLSFDAYVDDFSTSLSLSATVSTDKPQLDGAVAAGKKMNGVIGYEVPSDWTDFEIRFTPDFWSGKKITFVATN